MSKSSSNGLEEQLRGLSVEDWLETAGEGEEEAVVDYDTLVAYHQDRLGEAEAARVRRALAADPALAEALLVLDELEDPSPAEGLAEPRTGSAEAAWDRFEAALVEEAIPAAETRSTESPTPTIAAAPAAAPAMPAALPFPADRHAAAGPLRSAVVRNPLAALAAMFVLASGLGFLAANVLGPVLPGKSPGGEAVTGEILFEELRITANAGPTRSTAGAGGVPVLEVPAHIGEVVLTLEPPPSLELSSDLPVLAEFSLWHGDRQRARGTAFLQDERIYVLRLPAAVLGAGSARIELRDGEHEEVLAVYAIDVVPAP